MKNTCFHAKTARTLNLGNTLAEIPSLAAAVQVSPNPFTSRLGIALSANLRSPAFRLYDQTRHLLRQEWLNFGITEIDTHALPPGMYFWQVTSRGEAVNLGKLIKTGSK